jgi:Domain of unknown function (DUF1707)/Cell wall-active antibiotics response 4TMS YvqF
MGNLPALRASDLDRERTVAQLREHAAEGRLTLEEFTERMSAAYLARTNDDLEGLARDLPTVTARAGSRRRPTRFLLAVLGSSTREGRLRVSRRIGCLMGLGNIDLDLRQATFEGDTITIVAFGVLGAIDVYVPEGVEVDVHGFALGGHRRARGNDPAPVAGTPLVRVLAFSVFAGIDVWRVPTAWTAKSRRDVIRGIRSGVHSELDA